MAERAYFLVCLAMGRLLRSARYTRAPIAVLSAQRFVRKRRAFYAPLLIWMGGLVVRVLNTGTRVLAQRQWEERERLIYQTLHGTSIQVEADGTLVLPYLAGRTLAVVLEDPALEEPAKKNAIERAVVALAEFHQLGFTHADAMAENVLVDSCVAHWFDFETIHDPNRPLVWRRADDVRALLSSCVLRTVPAKYADVLQLVFDSYGDAYRESYGDEDVARLVAMNFTLVWRRSLSFHLAQAALSFQGFREVGRLLHARREGVHS